MIYEVYVCTYFIEYFKNQIRIKYGRRIVYYAYDTLLVYFSFKYLRTKHHIYTVRKYVPFTHRRNVFFYKHSTDNNFATVSTLSNVLE